MTLPVKALQEGNYIVPESDKPLPSASHEMSFIKFTDADGEEKTGWLKRLNNDGSYPEFLANLSVAFSVRMRMAVDRVAEDRLCCNKDGEVIGTVSLSLPNFKPLLCYGESVDDSNDEKLRNPSVETLLEYNVAELLVASALSKDNDCHPGNFSLFGVIDHDERFYRLLTMIIKGPRLITIEGFSLLATPTEVLVLSDEDISNFPFSRDRTFTPTVTYPNNGNFYKTYQAYLAFQQLASNPSITTDKGVITFQEQFFYALLKEMISFEPDVLRARLTEYLGDRPLRFLALGKEKSTELARAYPNLFKLPKPAQKGVNGEPDIAEEPGNDDESFVDVMMRFFQDEYDEAYRVIVYYMGCLSNSANTPVMSFSQYLQNKPDAFESIIEESRKKNDQIIKRWQAELLQKQQSLGLEQPSGADYTPPKSCHDLDKMRRRYYQVWRDAHTLMLDDLISKAHDLSLTLQTQLCEIAPILSSSPQRLTITDRNVTSSSQLLTYPSQREKVELDCDSANPIGIGWGLLNNFINELRRCIASYYALECKLLSMEENIATNQTFCRDLNALLASYSPAITAQLSSTSWGDSFKLVSFELTQSCERLNFIAHTQNKAAASKFDYSSILGRKPTDPDVIKEGLDALFAWAEKEDKITFTSAIMAVVLDYEAHFLSSVFGYRRRGNEVKEYLKSSSLLGKEPLSNEVLLAHIFSQGGVEETSLNTLLIKRLLPLVIGDTPTNTRLRTIAAALKLADGFNAKAYSEAAQRYVYQHSYFNSPLAKKNVLLFCHYLYATIGRMDVDTFRHEIGVSLSLYLSQRSSFKMFTYFYKPGREDEIRGYLNCKLDNQTIWASIFEYELGGCEANSFNTILFNSVIKKMERSCSLLSNSEREPIHQWLLGLNLTEGHDLRARYLEAQKEYAKQFLRTKNTTLELSSSSSSSCVPL